MEKKVYELEVGVHLDKDNEKYEHFALTGENEPEYYDENIIAFFDYAKAKKYADNYVKNGVNSTYAFISAETYNLDDKDIEYIENFRYFNHDIVVPPISDWLYYIYKDNNGEIKTLIDKGE